MPYSSRQRSFLLRCGLVLLLPLMLWIGYPYLIQLKHWGYRVKFSRDGSLLATAYGVRDVSGNAEQEGDYRGYCAIYTGTVEKHLLRTKRTALPYVMDFSPDGEMLVLGHTTGLVTVWDIHRRIIVQRCQPSRYEIHAIQFHDDGQELLVITDEGILRVDVLTGDFHSLFALREDQHLLGTSLASRRPHVALAIEDQDGSQLRLVFDCGQQEARQIAALPGSGRSFWLSPDATKVLCYTSVRPSIKLGLWRIADGQLESELPLNAILLGNPWSPDGSMIAIFAPPKELQIWDGNLTRQLAAMDIPTADYVCTAFSPDQTKIATTSERNGRTSVWDLPNGRLVQQYDGNSRMAWPRVILAAVLVGWWIAFIGLGLCAPSATRAIGDVILLGVVCLMLCIMRSLVGDVYNVQRLSNALGAGIFGSYVILLSVFLFLGRIRWSLRVAAFLGGSAVLWSAPLLIWMNGKAARVNLHLMLTVGSTLACLFAALFLLHRRGLTLRFAGPPPLPNSAPGKVWQVPLGDVMLWTAGLALLVAVGKHVVPGDISILDLLADVAAGAIVGACSIAVCLSSLSRSRWIYHPLVLLLAVGCSLLQRHALGGPPIWWNLAWLMTLTLLTMFAVEMLRWHGLQVVREPTSDLGGSTANLPAASTSSTQA